MKKTTLRQNITEQDREWFIIDADGKTLGKIAVIITNSLRGKDRADFTPHSDMGAHVVVLNAEKVVLSGTKEEYKKYYSHSGYTGNLKVQRTKDLRAKKPRRILELAVSGMLPKNKLRKPQMRRLHLVIGSKNPHEAQKAQPLSI